MFAIIDALWLRCNQVDRGDRTFNEIVPDLSDDHPFSSFERWPNIDAKMGPDYAFAQ